MPSSSGTSVAAAESPATSGSQNLLDLAADEDYEAIAHHRTNALERTMLIAMRQDLASSD